MAIARIEQVQSGVRVSPVHEQQIRRRLELYRDSSFERGASVTLTDGNRVDLPGASAEQVATLAKHYDGLGADGQQAFEQVSASFAAAVSAEVKSNPAALEGRVSSAFTAARGGAVQGFVGVDGSSESAAYEAIMVGSITYLENDIAEFANEVQRRTDLGREARTDISELRDALVDWPDDGSEQTFSFTEVKFNKDDGSYEVVAHTDEPLTKAQATALMDKLEMQQASISDMTEMMRFDLQKKYEVYQQALTLMANILKEQHDTMKATINNTKA